MNNIIRFSDQDSRIGSHSYSGYTLYFSLCDGKSHYRVRDPQGLRGQDTSCEKLGACDGTCTNGTPVDPEELPGAAQEVMGIRVQIPTGSIFVRPLSCNVQGYGYYEGFEIHVGGEEVIPADMKIGALLAEGETAKMRRTNDLGYHGKDYQVKNIGGKAEVSLHPDEIAAQKQFARDQLDKLVGLGFSRKKAVAIMRAAGPTLCVAAAEWTKNALSRVDYVLLECVLRGVASRKIGFHRPIETLKDLGIETPSFSKATPFFRFVAGAIAAL